MPSDTPIQGGAASRDDSLDPELLSVFHPPIKTPQHPPKPSDGVRPRIWTCFALLLVVFVVIIVFQVIGVVIMVVVLAVQGAPLDESLKQIPAKLTEPGWLIFVGILGQIPMLLGAIVAARLSPTESITQRLRLRQLGWPPSTYAWVALSVIPPAAIGMTAAWGLTFIIPPDPTVQQIYDKMTLPFVIPFLLFISLVPGFCEEFFFRGYLQGRFLERFGPWTAILMTSVIFGAFHIMPHAVLFATIVGLWLGYLAWKTNSIWPGIVCHALLNGIWNIFQIGSQMLGISDQWQYAILAVANVIGLVAFVMSVRLLAREQTVAV